MKSSSRRPSESGHRLISLLLRRGEHYSLIGDFDEIYAERVRESGRARARLWAWGQILRLLPAYAFHSLTWSLTMFKSYLRTSLRNIRKQKGYTLINILGLAIGIAACLLVLLYNHDELSFDRYNKKADRTVRIMAMMNRDGRAFNISGAGAPAAEALQQSFPEIEATVRFRQKGSLRVRFENKQFREDSAIHTDPSFFSVFTIPLLRGDPETALAEPNTLTVSRATALKYFGSIEAVGKTLRIDDGMDYKVTGVFENIPRASHFHFDILISLSTLAESREPVWMNFSFPTYLVLRPGASSEALEAKLPSVFNTHVNTELQQNIGSSLEDFLKKSNMTMDYRLQPLIRIRLFSMGGMNEFEPTSDIKYIYLFSAVALFILILAAVNFVNLSTARSSGRAKEVGLRKVLGSFRGALINQFLIESILLSLIALGFGFLIVGLALPLFNSLTGKELSLIGLAQPITAVLAVLLTLAIGLLAGAYPAFLLSSFRPSPILRGDLKSGVRGGRLRRILVVFQITASALMIIGTIVVSRQLRFIQTTKLGFNKDQVLILNNTSLLQDRAEILKTELLNLPQVQKASLSGFLPVPSSRMSMPVAREGEPDPLKAVPINVWTVDEDYLETLQMKIIEGRNFSSKNPTDTEAVLLNQAALKHFGFETAAGQRLLLAERDPDSPALKLKPIGLNVIGVVEDFHFESFRHVIAPLMIRSGKNRGNLILRVKPEGIATVIKALQTKWTSNLPGEPFEYSFLDERFNAMYKSELRVGRTFGVFAGLAVFIGCLGLFGLASYAAAKRAREIGIHKVLGATGSDIIRLMVKEYLFLTALANLIAWPVAFGVMSEWLKGFAYRTSIGWVVFAATGALTMIITLITVGGQSVKAAATDPAITLRNE